jgi:two-component system response regulator AlgR
MRVLIVDDETLARARLRRLLERLRPQAQVQEAASGEEALQRVTSFEPDLLLLDIRMPGMDGMAVAAALQQLDHPPAVIFCTAYDDHALAALQHHAVGYLLKPVREEQLAAVIDEAGRLNRVQLAGLEVVGSTPPRRSHLTSHTHRGLVSLPVDRINCLLAEEKYVRAVTEEGSVLLNDTLKELEAEFPRRFVRIHRNALVSLAHVQRLLRSADGIWSVELSNVSERPVISRRHLAAVKQRLEHR